MIAVGDLFGAPILPGLALMEHLIGTAEEGELIARIDAADLTPFQFQGWAGKRLTRSFGTKYDFTRGAIAPADPLPDWLLSVRDRAAAFAGLEPAELGQALVIRYDPGAGIGWHRDRPVYGHVLGISLGAPATMRFRRRDPSGFERVGAALEPRSVYHLSGEARHGWEHSIAPLERVRWSITFRSLARRETAEPYPAGEA